MKKLSVFYLFAITGLLSLSSCGLIIKSYIRKDTENVPSDFGKEKTTLLVIQERKGYNKKVDKIIKDHYSGPYVLIKRDELNNKYADKESYRYMLDDEIHITRSSVTTVTTNRSTGMSTRSTSPRSSAGRSFYVHDRKTNKYHNTGISSGTSWKKILKTYLQKLDKERKKNESN